MVWRVPSQAELRLAVPPGGVLRVLQLRGLDQVLPLYPTLEAGPGRADDQAQARTAPPLPDPARAWPRPAATPPGAGYAFAPRDLQPAASVVDPGCRRARLYQAQTRVGTRENAWTLSLPPGRPSLPVASSERRVSRAFPSRGALCAGPR